jgi:hypothetical protein
MVVLKCGPKGSQVRSCAQYRCARPSDYAQCLAASGGAEAVSGREPVGEVSVASGNPVVHRLGSAGSKEDLQMGMSVANGDRLVTGASDRVTIRFRDGSQLALSPRASVLIENYSAERKSGQRGSLIALEQGRVRARVKHQEAGAVPSFQIRTRTAVAGVRGTDFLAQYHEDQERAVTSVQTLTGEVALGRLGTQPEADPRIRSIRAGEEGRFVAMRPSGDLNSLEAWRRASESGQFLPIRPLDGAELREIQSEFGSVFEGASRDSTPSAPEKKQATVLPERPEISGELDPPAKMAVGADVRAPSSVAVVCQSPAAAFGQCKFQKMVTPSGGASCVRSICNASGRWSQPTVLPGNQAFRCDGGSGQAVHVAECGPGL